MRTRTQHRKHISELTMDLEILNPVETKSLLGGYNWEYLDEVSVRGSSHGNDSWWYTNPGNNWGSGYSGSNDTGNNGGGGGGGSIDPGDGVLRNAPDHICVQFDYGNTCATMALSYIANYLGGTGLTSSDFAEMAGINYNAMIFGIAEGLSGTQLFNIMSTIFQSTQISTYDEIVSNLNNGNPVLVTLDQGNGIGHEVVITGLNTYTGNITYMDSLKGGAVTLNLVTNPLSFTGQMYAVTGIQNNATVNQYKNDTNDVKCGVCGH